MRGIEVGTRAIGRPVGHPRIRLTPRHASRRLVRRPADCCAEKGGGKPCVYECNTTMSIKNALFAALVSFLLLAPTCRAEGDDHEAEHEDEHHEESKTFEANPVWGYSFLFNFLACLPSAFAIIVCLWAKLKVADKVITSLMVFASGVIFAFNCPSTFHNFPNNLANAGPYRRSPLSPSACYR